MILTYLVDKYDTDNKISFPAGSNEAYLTKQWLYYQTTGQGPYYGQAVVSFFFFFSLSSPSFLPSSLFRFSFSFFPFFFFFFYKKTC